MWLNPWIRNIPWRRKWQPTPVFLPGKSHGWRSLAGWSPWGRKRVRHDLATKITQISSANSQNCIKCECHWAMLLLYPTAVLDKAQVGSGFWARLGPTQPGSYFLRRRGGILATVLPTPFSFLLPSISPF